LGTSVEKVGRVIALFISAHTDEGATGRAGLAAWIGRDDFDPARLLPAEQQAHICGAIVATLSPAMVGKSIVHGRLT
jgi:hypothetical protein